jgi:hypothetical protein
LVVDSVEVEVAVTVVVVPVAVEVAVPVVVMPLAAVEAPVVVITAAVEPVVVAAAMSWHCPAVHA